MGYARCSADIFLPRIARFTHPTNNEKRTPNDEKRTPKNE